MAAPAVVLAAQAAREAAQAALSLQAVAAVTLAAQVAAQADSLWAVAAPTGLPQEAQANMCFLPRQETFLLRPARRGAMMVSKLTRSTSPMRCPMTR